MNAVSSSVDSPEVVCEAAPSDSEVVRADSVSGIYSREQIIERIKALLEMPVEEVKDEIDALKQLYYKQRKNEIEEAHRKYDEKTDGEKGEFQIPFDSLEDTLKGLLNVFKEKKAAYIEAIEKEKEENLARKHAILDEIKGYLQDPDNIGKYYNDFKERQQAFKEIVNVPASAVSELWKNFQTYSENFYDLLKIHKELRDYDFKKNLEQKISLCEQAEALAENTDILDAFKTLQSLHEEWRGIGPVAKEMREEIWNRFKEASTVINKRHQQYFETIKATEQANEQSKIALCEEIEAIDLSSLQSFSAWDEMTKKVLDMQERWKAVGFASRKVNAQLFERFRKSCDLFFSRKADYYKSVKDTMSVNLEKKRALCEQAEALKESTDWRAVSDKLTQLQKEWRTIGAVPRKYSDTVWKRFTEACDYFFERKKQEFASKRSEEQNNLSAKQAVIEKLNAIDETLDKNEGLVQVRALMAEWAAIGHVPFKEKDKLRKQYQTALDSHFKRWNMKETRNRLDAFSNTVEELASSDQAQNKLYRERERLMRAYEGLKNNLQTYQNNMGFLNVSSKSGNKMIEDLERKIEKLKDDMQLIVQKIGLIDEKLQ
ncbi:MAG TPA: DUF349 domain-containing protein [Candidatus Caccoplasma intestinavium]|uniref:DUF349 domain-containing protein n=1 Tax=Candidatus Caccoplasma intestinavium TaxID=2840716 RepID=A0A9D1GDA4_9BACT|nr:DUF349 domain-containing protein [Candidatus Caccoplasma intestinavium]